MFLQEKTKLQLQSSIIMSISESLLSAVAACVTLPEGPEYYTFICAYMAI